MIWLTWRQHRAILLVGIASLIFLIVSFGREAFMRYAFHENIIVGYSFLGFGSSFQLVLALIPALIGVFLGAPLVAREREQQTHYLAWTQGISRTRWLTTKLFGLVPVTVLSMAALNAVVFSYLQPEIQQVPSYQGGSMLWSYFALYGPLLTMNTLFALLLGVAIGTVLPRVVPAMAVTLVVFVLVMTGLTLARENYMPQKVIMQQPNGPEIGWGNFVPEGAWFVYHGFMDKDGNRLGGNFNQICGYNTPQSVSDAEAAKCRGEKGLVWINAYIPRERYWPYQVIESSILLILSALLVPLTFWWLRRRVN